MGFYEQYKPFRNYMRPFILVDSLVDIWRYSQYILDNKPLPPNYALGKPPFEPVRRHIWPWALDILARETVFNAAPRGDRSLRRWNDLAGAINHIRDLDNAAYAVSGDERDVLFEMHRIDHRQFPWQIKMGVNPVMRALKIFGRDAVDAIVVREFGMTMRQVLLMGIAMTGHFQKAGNMSINQDYHELGIPQAAANAFLARLTSPIYDLRAITAKQQSYGPDWLYAWNPLEAAPLVAVDRTRPDRGLCPLPFFLLRRTSTGVFYDLVTSP